MKYYDFIDGKITGVRSTTAAASPLKYAECITIELSTFKTVTVDYVTCAIQMSLPKQCGSDPLPSPQRMYINSCTQTLQDCLTCCSPRVIFHCHSRRPAWMSLVWPVTDLYRIYHMSLPAYAISLVVCCLACCCLPHCSLLPGCLLPYHLLHVTLPLTIYHLTLSACLTLATLLHAALPGAPPVAYYPPCQ